MKKHDLVGDTNLLAKVADVISAEARAKNNEFVRNNERGRYKGLTFAN